MRIFPNIAADSARPDRAACPAPPDLEPLTIREPRFVTLPDIRHRFRGRRPNGLEGAIVHYDAGRTAKRDGTSGPEYGARATLRHGERNGYAYCTVALDGTIMLPANMDWLSWGSHAGLSVCPSTGRNWVSRYYVGFEVNCPGFVYPTAEPEVFVPWFNAVRDLRGVVQRDSRGHARRVAASDLSFTREEVVHVAGDRGNMRDGFYAPFTQAQIDALTDTLLWLKREFAPTFSLERVFGHDEVSPNRKIDPGGSLGMNMGAFRAHLLKKQAEMLAAESLA